MNNTEPRVGRAGKDVRKEWKKRRKERKSFLHGHAQLLGNKVQLFSVLPCLGEAFLPVALVWEYWLELGHKHPSVPTARSLCAKKTPHSYPSKPTPCGWVARFSPSPLCICSPPRIFIHTFTHAQITLSGRSNFSQSAPSPKTEILLRTLEYILSRQIELEALSLSSATPSGGEFMKSKQLCAIFTHRRLLPSSE